MVGNNRANTDSVLDAASLKPFLHRELAALVAAAIPDAAGRITLEFELVLGDGGVMLEDFRASLDGEPASQQENEALAAWCAFAAAPSLGRSV